MKSSFVSKGIGILAFIVVVVYFGSSVIQYFLDPLTTTIAYDFRSEESTTVTGFLVREEQVLPSADSNMVYLPREEGERISKGGQVAVVYHSAEAMAAARKLEDLELQLEQLEYAGSVLSGAQVAMKLDDNILDDIYTLRLQMVRGELDEARSRAGNLRTLVVRRDYAHSATGEEDLANQITQLQQQINSLTVTASSGRSFVRTDRTGFFSALVDGYEQVLTPDMLEELTPSGVDSVTAAADVSSNVGKLITSETWYFVTNVRASEVGDTVEGDTVYLRFVSGLDRDLEMSVHRISEEENGKRTVVLSSDRYISLTTLLRNQTAQLIWRTYDGIRVPRNAVRVVEETIEKEDGAKEVSRFTGVYCRMGRSARLKPVTVLYEGEEYYLVVPDQEILARYVESTQAVRTLRGGDEVIITAQGLYDGKAVS